MRESEKDFGKKCNGILENRKRLQSSKTKAHFLKLGRRN